jgi:hypothetical protein
LNSELKTCSTCKESKPKSEYGVITSRKDGLAGQCKPCRRASGKKWRDGNREHVRNLNNAHYSKHREERKAKQREYNRLFPEKAFAHKLRRDYNLSVEDFERMHADQDGKCAICKNPEIRMGSGGKVRRLNVDHNAVTGKVRQLLCCDCNTGIGLLRHSTDILNEAISYLERHSL